MTRPAANEPALLFPSSSRKVVSRVKSVIQRSSRSSTVRWIGAAVFERKVAVVIERSSRNARFHRWVPIAHRPGISVDRAGGPRARGMKCTSREPSIRPDETLTVSTVVSERGWCWKKLLRARTVCLAVARRWRDLSMHRARPLRRAAARNIGRVPSNVQGCASGSSRTRSARTHGRRGPPRASRSVSARGNTPRLGAFPVEASAPESLPRALASSRALASIRVGERAVGRAGALAHLSRRATASSSSRDRMADADVGRSPRFFTPEHFSPRAGDGSEMQQTAGGLKRAASQMTDDEQNDRVRKILSLVKVFLTGTIPHRSPSTPRRAPRRVPSPSPGKGRGDAPAAWRAIQTRPASETRRTVDSIRTRGRFSRPLSTVTIFFWFVAFSVFS